MWNSWTFSIEFRNKFCLYFLCCDRQRKFSIVNSVEDVVEVEKSNSSKFELNFDLRLFFLCVQMRPIRIWPRK